VYVGDYSTGYIAFMPKDDTHKTGSCGYTVVRGSTLVKKLRPVKVRGAQDSEGNDKYHTLQAFALYPSTDTAIVRIWNIKGSQLLKLQKGLRSNIFKMRL